MSDTVNLEVRKRKNALFRQVQIIIKYSIITIWCYCCFYLKKWKIVKCLNSNARQYVQGSNHLETSIDQWGASIFFPRSSIRESEYSQTKPRPYQKLSKFKFFELLLFTFQIVTNMSKITRINYEKNRYLVLLCSFYHYAHSCKNSLFLSSYNNIINAIYSIAKPFIH